ncbi:hypothetical protein TNCV_1631271 [Trichonephila clavipes]|nr:hypothetical protein TNCV_1631271 [Trichonephila clavipes]
MLSPFPTIFPEHPRPSVLTLPVLVRKGFSLNSFTLSLYLFLLFGESFHYPSSMDPPVLDWQQAAIGKGKRHDFATLAPFLPYGIMDYTPKLCVCNHITECTLLYKQFLTG